jgi:NAD(P)-dependent dehydrogenase (short-subunit alcohol dehydrogenase family)
VLAAGHVVVDNAGNYAGFFEELSPEQVRVQIETLRFGPMNATRAPLPTMREQRSGLLLTSSSTAGVVGGMVCTACAAVKFGPEQANAHRDRSGSLALDA